MTFQSPDVIYQARPLRRQKAVFSEIISAGIKGLTDGHAPEKFYKEFVHLSNINSNLRSFMMNLTQRRTLTSSHSANRPRGSLSLPKADRGGFTFCIKVTLILHRSRDAPFNLQPSGSLCSLGKFSITMSQPAGQQQKKQAGQE